MREHLVFVLCAPMGAFGSYAGHERRGSDLVPPRSAVLGLIGAALGVERADAGGQAALRRYGVATRSLTHSAALRDYHTVQTVPARVRRPNSRRAAIDAIGREINTTITVRDYRTDVAVAVAVWGRDERWSLEQVAAALRHPAFVLFLGRKSCPLAAPVNPCIVEAPDPVAALRDCPAPIWLRHVAGIASGTITSDPFSGGMPDRVVQAPVEPLDRTVWHFGQGDVWHFRVEADT